MAAVVPVPVQVDLTIPAGPIRQLIGGLAWLWVNGAVYALVMELVAQHKSIAMPIAFWGAIKAGIVPVPVNTLLATDQYQYILSDCRATAGVDPSAAARRLDELCVIAPRDDAEDAAAFARRVGARFATVGGAFEIPAALASVL